VKLYLDDIRECPFVGWTVARDVDAAMAAVREAIAAGDEWTHASLDHDMSVPQTMGYMEADNVPTGLHFVDWMIQTNTWPTYKPAVHSMNPVGAKRMRDAIERYGPYGCTVRRNA
jgi:hypothetical protein